VDQRCMFSIPSQSRAPCHISQFDDIWCSWVLFIHLCRSYVENKLFHMCLSCFIASHVVFLYLHTHIYI
jgi:hypothetical protein